MDKILSAKTALVISHTDLDGVVSAQIADIFLRENNYKVVLRFFDYSTPGSFTSKFVECLDSQLQAEQSLSELYILDISLHKETCLALANWLKEHPGVMATWVDHHATSTAEDFYDVTNILTYINAHADSNAELTLGVFENLYRSTDNRRHALFLQLVSYAALMDTHNTKHADYNTACKLSDAIAVAGPDRVKDELANNLVGVGIGVFSDELNGFIGKAAEAKKRSIAMGLGSACSATICFGENSYPCKFAVCSGFGSAVLDALLDNEHAMIAAVVDTTYGTCRATALRLKKTPDCELHIGDYARILGGGGHELTGGVVLSGGDSIANGLFTNISKCIRNLCKHLA